MKQQKKNNKANSEENKKPKWWIVSIVAPIIVGLTIWIVQKSADPIYGELQIFSDTDSAKVFLNEQPSGLTIKNESLIVSSLKPGNYFLSIKKGGFANYDTQNVKIAAGEITSLKAILLPQTQKVVNSSKNKTKKYNPVEETTLYSLTITVQSQFKNAKILIDGQWKANAPYTVSLSQGQHLLRIEKNDYFYEEMIDVPGRSLINVLDDEFQKLQATKD